MPGQPTHFEIGVPDAARAKAFYGPLLGWTFHPMGDGDEGWIETGGVRGGLHDNDADAVVMPYFAVADLDAVVAKVRDLGGVAADAGPDQPGFGRFAECRDDQGVRFGLHQSG